MTDTVILVTHHADDPRDDRASRTVADLGYRTEWVCPRAGGRLPDPDGRYVGAIVYGGPHSVNAVDEYPYMGRELDWTAQWVASGKSFLGLCLGGQILAHALGAKVTPHPGGLHEIGFHRLEPTEAGCTVFGGPQFLYQFHYEGFAVPNGGELLASSEAFPHQAFRYGANAYGFQFHPEVTPAMMARWLGRLADRLSKPGAHPRERQVADSARYSALMGQWLDGFLARWLKGGQGLSRK